MAPGAAIATPAPFLPEGLLYDLMEVSLTAVNVLRPVQGPTGDIVDFTLDYLNPAAQRMSRLPERPGGTLLSHRPTTATTGILDYYRRAFETGTTDVHEVNYQADGLDNFFRLAARRSGEWLVVSFTDTADQDRSAVEVALREAQAAEKAARADAEQQRNELRDFLELAPAAVAVYRGPEHRVELANATTLAIWDCALSDVLGRPVFDVLPEAATPDVRALFERVFATGVSHTAIEQPTVIHRHGRPETVYWNFVFQPEFQPDGRVRGIRSVGTEVTAQVRGRQQLEQLNQELEARVQARTREVEAARAATERERRQWEDLFRTAPAGICIFDGPQWVYQFVNSSYQAMFPGRELLGKRLVEALPEVADQPLMAILHRVYDTGEPFQESEVLVPLARTEGGPIEAIYFDLTYQARRNEAGQIDGFVTYAFDVTEQVLARQERAGQQRQLREVFEQAPVAIFVVRGAEYVFEVVNPGMAAIVGSPPDQVLGQRYFDLLPALADQGYRKLLDEVWHTGQAYVAQEQAAQMPHHREGEMGYYNFNYVPVREAEGRVTGIMCVAVDVTPQVRARQRVQELNEELATSNTELHESNRQLTRTNVDLDTFVYTASHDLKAPITNIESILLALRDTLPAPVQQDEVVAQLLAMLQDTVTRFQLTIAQLTDISKLQLAHAGPAEPVRLAQALDNVRLDLVPALTAAGTQLTVEVAPELIVSFSPSNLRSIVYNLLSNAVKYRAAARPSQVRVHAAQTASGVVLTVQDNGLGMSAVQQRQLFGLFQRLHTHVEGTGVGLYITKRLVENAGGTITVQSQPDAGTTFTVTFPA
jgi:PAS domain S-box-containing protein